MAENTQVPKEEEENTLAKEEMPDKKEEHPVFSRKCLAVASIYRLTCPHCHHNHPSITAEQRLVLLLQRCYALSSVLLLMAFPAFIALSHLGHLHSSPTSTHSTPTLIHEIFSFLYPASSNKLQRCLCLAFPSPLPQNTLGPLTCFSLAKVP
jgi:hypothetical protein